MKITGPQAALRWIAVAVWRAGRSPCFLIDGLGIPLGLYLIYTVIGVGGGADAPPGIDRPAYLMVAMGALGAMSVAVGTAAGPFRTHHEASVPRLTAWVIAAFILSLVPLLLVGLAGSRVGVRLSAIGWSELIVALWLGVVPFVALGLLLGLILEPETGEIVLVGVLVLLAILGGYFQPIETLPTTLSAIGHVVPSYHLADLGWTTLADHAIDPVDVLALAGWTVAIVAILVWRKRSEGAPGAERAAGHDGAGTR